MLVIKICPQLEEHNLKHICINNVIIKDLLKNFKNFSFSKMFI